MTTLLDVFAPPFGLLLLGAILRRHLLPDRAVWAGIERLVFWVLMPALLIAAIGTVDPATLPLGRLAATLWATILLGAAASMLLARAARLDHPAMTSALQGGIKFNNIMGFALVAGVSGTAGTALGAVITGIAVPFVHLLTGVAFAAAPSADGPRPNPWRMVGTALLNPLVTACAIGFTAAALGGLPPGIGPLLRSLGAAALALGLLAVGAALVPGVLAARPGLLLAVAAIKLALMPALAYALGRAIGLDDISLAVAVLFMALPPATTSYVVARAMGGDAPLMAALTTVEHLLAVATLPLWLALLAR